MEKQGSLKASLRNNKHFTVVYHRGLPDALEDALLDLDENHHHEEDSGSLGDTFDAEDLEQVNCF